MLLQSGHIFTVGFELLNIMDALQGFGTPRYSGNFSDIAVGRDRTFVACRRFVTQFNLPSENTEL